MTDCLQAEACRIVRARGPGRETGMNSRSLQSARKRAPVVLTLAGLTISLFAGTSQSAPKDGCNCPCGATASAAKESCGFGVRQDYWLAIGTCRNLPAGGDFKACRRDAQAVLDEEQHLCREQYAARIDLCSQLGGDAYNPVIDPDDFVDTIDNPYFPLTPGTTSIYEGQTDAGFEHVEVQVTRETKTILGVSCVVVRDIARLDGVVVEDTLDWYAQDRAGNVWYFGELSQQFEGGELAGLAGSWQAGVDGAQAGVIMRAAPRGSDVYRQEFALEVAEDIGEIVALGQSVTVPFGSFANCLKTNDFSPIEPDVLENKYYAPGIGVVLEVDPETGERLELVDVESD